jgi:hypothetical protein
MNRHFILPHVTFRTLPEYRVVQWHKNLSIQVRKNWRGNESTYSSEKQTRYFQRNPNRPTDMWRWPGELQCARGSGWIGTIGGDSATSVTGSWFPG